MITGFAYEESAPERVELNLSRTAAFCSFVLGKESHALRNTTKPLIHIIVYRESAIDIVQLYA